MMPVEVDTHCLGLIEFESGGIGQMMTSFDVWDSETPRFEIYGEAGTICIPDPDPVHGANVFEGDVWVRTRETARWTHQPRPTGRDAWQVAENTHGFNDNARGLGLWELAHAVREGCEPRASAEMALHVCEAMQGMLDLPWPWAVRRPPEPLHAPGSAAGILPGRKALMPVRTLDFAEPFFSVRIVTDSPVHRVAGKVILLNLSENPVQIRTQRLGHLQSTVVADVELRDVAHAVVVERFADHGDEAELLARVRRSWPSAFDVRREERLRGVSHYMSPKVWVGQYGFTMYHSGSVPLNVGLHRDHAFCPVPGFREVHTQIVGIGKMQQCRENDVSDALSRGTDGTRRHASAHV